MADALTLLRLQAEWGADEALEPAPVNRLRPLPPLPPLAAPSLRPLGDTPELAAGQPRITPADRAAERAGQAASLAALRDSLLAFDGCALRDTASNLVFAEGDPASTTLIIGEPPGREEDRGGHPFVGADGALLDQMLGSIALARSALMLTPLLPWRPPGGRPPNTAEMAVCLPFLHRLIVLLGPRRLVIFGATATRALLSSPPGRRRQTAGWIDCRIPGLPLALPALSLPSFAEMQKTPPSRRLAWAGLRLLRRAIDAEITET